MRINQRILIVLLAAMLTRIPALGQAPSPVVEFSSILTSLDAHHHDGRLQLEDDNAALATAFLPAGTAVDVMISQADSNRPLVIQPLAVASKQGVFNRLGIRGQIQSFRFTAPGQYVATYRAGGKPITVVPFRVEMERNQDQFDPKTHVYLSGPWSEWAYLFASVAKGSDANPELRFWVRKKSFLASPPADRYTAEIRRSGDLVAVSESGSSNSKKWQFMRLRFQFPGSKGGGPIKLNEIITGDGPYQILIHRNDKPHAAFTMNVRQGQIVMHARQQTNHEPRTEYIVPRFPGLLGTLGNDSAGHAFWFQRQAFDPAELNEATANVPTKADLDRWNWLPRSIDPNRDFRVRLTEIATRNDTHLAAGEDLVVFGTGFPNGVAYMRVGDTSPREIPSGETFNAKVFGVCGTKIVLVRGKQVAVYDTNTEQLFPIDESEVSLYSPSNHSLATNGFLVGTINNADVVSDKTIIKVIDISGPEPVVIPINNAEYTHRDATSLCLDAKQGMVAVSSQSKKLIAVAPIATRARQHVYALDDFRGVGPQRIFLEDEWITYGDSDWKVRLLKLGDTTPQAITDEAFPRAGNGFFVRKGRLAVASMNQKVGSRYRFAVGDLDDSPIEHDGTGSPLAETGGHLGMGGSAAIAIDKTVFIAGTPGDRIGTGEYLMMLDEKAGWIPVLGPSGQPIPASDVATSTGLLAFKTLDAAGKTVVGTCTYGQRISYTPPKQKDSTDTLTQPDTPAPSKTQPKSSMSKLSENDEAFLAEMLKNEKTIYDAYKAAFGPDEAKKKVVDGIKQTLKNSGKEHLVDEYLKRSGI